MCQFRQAGRYCKVALEKHFDRVKGWRVSNRAESAIVENSGSGVKGVCQGSEIF